MCAVVGLSKGREVEGGGQDWRSGVVGKNTRMGEGGCHGALF